MRLRGVQNKPSKQTGRQSDIGANLVKPVFIFNIDRQSIEKVNKHFEGLRFCPVTLKVTEINTVTKIQPSRLTFKA
jgi:hypothetical protein